MPRKKEAIEEKRKEIFIDKEWKAQTEELEADIRKRASYAKQFLEGKNTNQHFIRDTNYISKIIKKELIAIGILFEHKEYLNAEKLSDVEGIEQLEIEAIEALSTYHLDREQYEGILEIEYAPSIIQIDKTYILENCVPLLVNYQITRIDAFIRQYLISLALKPSVSPRPLSTKI